jgi:lipoprotein-releasing system permease protein
MNLPFEWRVALRHLRSRRRNAFISLITGISLLGVALGVAALIAVISVMSGFSGYVKDRILATTAHVLVQGTGGSLADYRQAAERIAAQPGVRGASPYVLGQAMMKVGGAVTGVVVRGVDPAREGEATDLARNMAEGRLDELGEDGIVLGIEMVRLHGLRVGDQVTLISSSEISTPMGMIPLLKKFRLVGYFNTGMYEYDTGLALVSLPAAQSFFDLGDAATGVAVRVEDIYGTRDLGFRLQALLGDRVWVRDWREMNQNLFSALKLEKITMWVILTLIVVVAAFNIVGTLVMVVMEKGREIAILKAMGATRSSIGRIFFLEGSLIGIAGTLIGLVLGLALCWALSRWHFVELPSSVYYVSTIQVRVDALDISLICLAAVAISMLAGLYPARRASRLDPVEILRYE